MGVSAEVIVRFEAVNMVSVDEGRYEGRRNEMR